MKKKLIITIFLTLIALASSAKLYIPLVKSVPPTTSNGGQSRVGVRTGSYAPLAYIENEVLYIEYPVSIASSVIITNDSTDIVVLNNNYDVESNSIQIDLNSFFRFQNNYNLSVHAYGTWWVGYLDYYDYLSSTQGSESLYQNVISTMVNQTGKDRNYGFFGIAGNAATGWNYAVSGILYGENGGSGIYGSSKYDEGFISKDCYAGLFHGDLKTTDVVYATAYNTLADSRLNKDMEQILSGSLDKLMQINVYKYDLEQFSLDNGNGTSLDYFNNESELLDKKHFGLSGQEIKDIYPSLVSQSQDGHLSINYNEMIPIMIQSIQELKKELDETRAELNTLKSTSNVVSRATSQESVLQQNEPNPFRDKCIVKCYIPQFANTAFVDLYDLNGHQIQSRIITERGNVEVSIEGKGLPEGTYLYSLIVNGELIDTRRMIHLY